MARAAPNNSLSYGFPVPIATSYQETELPWTWKHTHITKIAKAIKYLYFIIKLKTVFAFLETTNRYKEKMNITLIGNNIVALGKNSAVNILTTIITIVWKYNNKIFILVKLF